MVRGHTLLLSLVPLYMMGDNRAGGIIQSQELGEQGLMSSEAGGSGGGCREQEPEVLIGSERWPGTQIQRRMNHSWLAMSQNFGRKCGPRGPRATQVKPGKSRTETEV